MKKRDREQGRGGFQANYDEVVEKGKIPPTTFCVNKPNPWQSVQSWITQAALSTVPFFNMSASCKSTASATM